MIPELVALPDLSAYSLPDLTGEEISAAIVRGEEVEITWAYFEWFNALAAEDVLPTDSGLTVEGIDPAAHYRHVSGHGAVALGSWLLEWVSTPSYQVSADDYELVP